MRLTIRCGLCLLAIILAGCVNQQETGSGTAVYTSMRDIPGVTGEEIRAVEELRKKYDSFTFGALGSTEAFYDKSGEIKGYVALLCEWLTKIFDIPFIPKIYEWGDLFPVMQEADFTGEFTATEERKNEYGFLFTDAIAERSTKYFRIAGSRSFSEITRTRALKFGFLEGSTTSIAAISKLKETLIPYETVYVNDYDSAYTMMKSGEIDAFIDEMVVEAVFDAMGNVVSDDFFPLIYEPVSLAAQNPEFQPIISIVQKALANGGIDVLAELYEQGIKEYARSKLFSRLDERELAFLRENTAVAYLAEFDNYPISFYNDNEKKWQGITFDILEEITSLTGLTFEPINDPDVSFADLMTILENGEGAMISELIPNDVRRGRFIWPENETFRDNFVAISVETMPNISVHRIMQLKVGVQTSTAYADLFHTWFPNHPHVVEYGDVNAAFKGLENGEVDILMLKVQHLLMITNYYERPGFKANIVFDYTFSSAFGFNRNEEILCSIIDKAMSIIDKEAISGQWLRKTFDYRTKIIRSQRPWLIGSILLLLVIIVLTFFLYRKNRRVGKRLEILVRQRTAELDISRQELSAALVDAKMANQAKSDFLATMSHEIRTPLNAIIGLTQIQLQKENLPDEYSTVLEKIFSSSNSLLGIINDILDMSKIETGKMELNPVEYDVPSVINDAVLLNIVRIGSKPIEFTLDIDEKIPSRLYGDELRLKQILNNLLSNAIKYTKEGRIKLTVDHSLRGDAVMLRFIVEDTGQGIKSEDRERLFSEYLRFNAKANRKTEGTGLGLNITKKLIEMMGGAIEVESEYGKGSTFKVTVQQKVVEYAAIGAEAAQKLRNFTFIGDRQTAQLHITREPMPYGSVLVVDDLETNLYVAEGMLLPYKLNIETANSGFAVIEKIESGKTYDIIFMDHMMPKMHGIETTEKLRQMGYKGVIVALTANAMIGNDEMFSRHGFDGFISKPIDIRHLNAVLNKFIRDRYPEEAKKYKPQAAESQSVTVPPDETTAKLLQVFRRDAEKAIITLRETAPRGDTPQQSAGDIKLLTTTAHAMKSALANVGETEKSRQAAALEKAGLNGDMDFIAAKTENFIKTLESLIRKLSPAQTAAGADVAEDTSYLKDQLQIIKTACEGYDDAAAYDALDRLQEKPWGPGTAAALETLRDMLFLHSDFEGAAEQVGALICE
jgi:signal transduction histidine kinase/CheY-like chemotaxis protein